MTLLWKIKDAIRKMIGGGYINCADEISPELTVVSSNCTGSLVCHEIGLRFNSPFVNLWIQPKDYLKLIENLPVYMEKELIFTDDRSVNYPVALLGDVKIYFQHYKTEDEAKSKWEQRKHRMNYNHICYMMVQKDGCTYDDIKYFDSMPLKNKVIFTSKPYPEFESASYIKGFEKRGEIKHMYEFESLISLKKYYYQFDMINFLKNT